MHALAAQLADELGMTCTVTNHVHFEIGKPPEGAEIAVDPTRPNRKVDAILCFEDGTKAIFQHEGDYFHGYPPGHYYHETYVCGHKWGPAKFLKTLADRDEQRTGRLFGLVDGKCQPTEYTGVYVVFGSYYHEYKELLKNDPLKTDPNTKLYYRFLPYVERLDLSAEAKEERAAEWGPSTLTPPHQPNEHTHGGGGCQVCKDTKRDAKEAMAAAAAAAATAPAPP